jgi:hypothetical protein
MRFNANKILELASDRSVGFAEINEILGFKPSSDTSRQMFKTHQQRIRVIHLTALADAWGVDLSVFFEFDGSEPISKLEGLDVIVDKDDYKDLRRRIQRLENDCEKFRNILEDQASKMSRLGKKRLG